MIMEGFQEEAEPASLPCKVKRLYLLTLQVDSYCLLALQNSTKCWIWFLAIAIQIAMASNQIQYFVLLKS